MSTPQHPSTNPNTGTSSGTTTTAPRFRAGAYLEGLLAEMAVNAVATLTHLGSPVSCGIAVVTGAHLVPVAASDSMARYLEHAQRRSGVGPGWDAALSQEPLYLTDTATESRWPDYLEVVRHSPIRSIFSIPFGINGESTGVLGLYSPAPDAFPHPLSARALHYVEQAASAIRPAPGSCRRLS